MKKLNKKLVLAVVAILAVVVLSLAWLTGRSTPSATNAQSSGQATPLNDVSQDLEKINPEAELPQLDNLDEL